MTHFDTLLSLFQTWFQLDRYCSFLIFINCKGMRDTFCKKIHYRHHFLSPRNVQDKKWAHASHTEKKKRWKKNRDGELFVTSSSYVHPTTERFLWSKYVKCEWMNEPKTFPFSYTTSAFFSELRRCSFRLYVWADVYMYFLTSFKNTYRPLWEYRSRIFSLT